MTVLFRMTVFRVDMYYTGYFDEEDENEEIQSSASSLESGLSMLKISD
jgi:hypothetical protein